MGGGLPVRFHRRRPPAEDRYHRDEHTREVLGGLVARSITGADLLQASSGPLSQAMADWATERNHGTTATSNPSTVAPTDVCLNINTFWTLTQARIVINDWKDDYNHRHRQSALGHQAPAVYARKLHPLTANSHTTWINSRGPARLAPQNSIELDCRASGLGGGVVRASPPREFVTSVSPFGVPRSSCSEVDDLVLASIRSIRTDRSHALLSTSGAATHLSTSGTAGRVARDDSNPCAPPTTSSGTGEITCTPSSAAAEQPESAGLAGSSDDWRSGSAFARQTHAQFPKSWPGRPPNP